MADLDYTMTGLVVASAQYCLIVQSQGNLVPGGRIENLAVSFHEEIHVVDPPDGVWYTPQCCMTRLERTPAYYFGNTRPPKSGISATTLERQALPTCLTPLSFDNVGRICTLCVAVAFECWQPS